ncbi:peptidylprolyl isomerase [Geodermatophilus sp. SYSU D00758]
MRTRRLTASLAAGLVALAGLSGCRTSPSVAAYVGEETVTVDELDAAVEQRLEDPDLAEAVAGREDEYTRLVLTRLVEAEVYEEVAERYGVAPTDAEVRDRLEQLLEGQDPEALYAQAAAQGVSREDVLATVRQQLVRQRIAEEEGLVQGTSEAELRAAYEEALPGLTRTSLGYVTVPDQATADAVVAQLQADPGAYPAVAAQYPGPTTLPAVEPRPADQVPSVLADQVAAAAPNTAFTVTDPGIGGVLVVFVGEPVVPSFEEVRPDLEEAARSSAEAAAREVVEGLRADVDITVNPRFGTISEGEVVPADQEVVDILGTGDGAGAAGAGD